MKGITKEIANQPKRNYALVSQQMKEQLLKLVLVEKMQIQDAANALSIKLNTAKTILQHFRKSGTVPGERTRRIINRHVLDTQIKLKCHERYCITCLQNIHSKTQPQNTLFIPPKIMDLIKCKLVISQTQ